jgi:hypothetical protein
MKKKIFLIILFIVVGLIVLYIGINLFDEGLRPGVYTEKDLLPASFDKNNGYYILWGLSEPGDVDVQSEAYTREIRQLFEPGPQGEMHLGNFNAKDYKSQFASYAKAIRKIKFPVSSREDWLTVIMPQAEEVEKAREACSLVLKRYEDLLTTPAFEDFTMPTFDTPIPNLMAWLMAAKLYTAVRTIEAVEGNWEASVQALLRHISFGKKAISHSRILIGNLIGKAVTNISLQGLASILNHRECPGSIYSMVLSGMPDLKYEEYGTGNAFIGECLSCFDIIDTVGSSESPGIIDDEGGFHLLQMLPEAIFLKENQTKNYFFDFYSMLIAFEKQDPHQWNRNTYKKTKESLKAKGAFRWLRNPLGKIILDIAIPNIAIIFKSYRTRTYYEMTRILAELHMKYSPGKPVEDILKELESYQSLDPCSGKPYVWEPVKKVLYSIGTDGVDNEGVEKLNEEKGSDFVIPVVFH